MSLKTWFVFVVLGTIVFCWAILPMTGNLAFLLRCFFGLNESAVPCALILSTVFIIGCMVCGAMDSH